MFRKFWTFIDNAVFLYAFGLAVVSIVHFVAETIAVLKNR